MSNVLDDNFEFNSPAQIAARRLIRMTRRTYKEMVASFNRGSLLFWQNSGGASPADIAEELGPNAAEVFALHARLGVLLAEVDPNAIAEGASVVGEFTMNQDGTVTVVESAD
jgi:hypothetical protein